MYASPAPAMGQYPGQYYAPAPKKNRTCCYSICSLIVFSIIIYAIYTSVPYLNPNVPLATIADISISELSISNANLTARTKLSIDLNITNPNAKVGIISKGYSMVKMNYKNAEICNGTMPYYQVDMMSSKVVRIDMVGESAFDKATKAYLDADVANGKVQLDVIHIFTVGTVVEGKQKQIKDLVFRCKMVVDNVDPNSEVRILSCKCMSFW